MILLLLFITASSQIIYGKNTVSQKANLQKQFCTILAISLWTAIISRQPLLAALVVDWSKRSSGIPDHSCIVLAIKEKVLSFQRAK